MLKLLQKLFRNEPGKDLELSPGDKGLIEIALDYYLEMLESNARTWNGDAPEDLIEDIAECKDLQKRVLKIWFNRDSVV